MTVVKSGPTKGYSENWEKVFGTKKSRSKPKAAAKTVAKKTPAKKAKSKKA